MTTAHDTSGMAVSEVLMGEAAEWLLRLRDPACSDATRAAFARWLARDAAHRVEFERAERTWRDLAPAATGLPELAAARAKLAAHRAARASGRARSYTGGARAWWRIPAAAAVALLLAFVGHAWVVEHVPSRQAAYDTAVGEIRGIRLDEGSRIEMNTGSRLEVALYRTRREVRLEHGEAWFDVARDPARPFRVAAGALAIEVTGTRFGVRMTESATSVVVEEGSVRVSRAESPDDSVLVTLGQGLEVDPQGGPLRATRIDLEEHLAWREGRLVFSARPLGEVAAELSRYRNGAIDIALEAARLSVSAVINIRSADEWLAALPRTLPVQTRRGPEGDWSIQPAAPAIERLPITPPKRLQN